MNDRRYRFEDDLEENNRIYEEINKDVVGYKSITTEQINRLANSTWLSSNKNINRCITIINKIKTNESFEKKHKECFIHFLRLLSRAGDLVVPTKNEARADEKKKDIEDERIETPESVAKIFEDALKITKALDPNNLEKQSLEQTAILFKSLNYNKELLAEVIVNIKDEEIKQMVKVAFAKILGVKKKSSPSSDVLFIYFLIGLAVIIFIIANN